MAGDYETKFAGARTYLTYMMTHPGKKLLFMGSELGMFREWNDDDELEWFMLDYDMLAKYQRFVATLNRFYLEHRELWDADEGPASFEWIDPDNSQESILSYRRIAENGEELVVFLNFLPEARKGFLAAVPKAGKYEEVFNSDTLEFGGKGNTNPGILTAKKCTLPRDYTHAVSITLPPMGAVVLRKRRKKKTNKAKPQMPKEALV
jgi:1,4-alpha-glucan branching enzyme